MSDSLADRILDGDIRAAARLMRLVDDDAPGAREQMDILFAHTGHAHIVGFTGNPGSGKSTLVDKFIEECRGHDQTVGCVVIDPTSPFSGGAILGDRIRMQRHALDEGVFIRSVATRGNLGGLSRSTPAMIQILDAMGFDFIVVETVGVGQDEVDVAAHADTCVVVTVPGLGDDIQAAKAGLLEIASLFVVNKSDLDGASRVKRELRAMLQFGRRDDRNWDVPILSTVATESDGTAKVYETILEHGEWLAESGRSEENAERRFRHLITLITGGDFRRRMEEVMSSDEWKPILRAVVERETSPYVAADALVEQLLRDIESED